MAKLLVGEEINFVNHLNSGWFFCVVGFGKPLKWLGFVVVLSHRCGINPAPMGYELWEFQNRFNDLIVIQFHIIKPM